MSTNPHFLVVYHAYDDESGKILNSFERILTREDFVSARTIDVHKEQIETQCRHGGPGVTVVVHAISKID